jgi:Arc/MetJ-type ribon-helix-helix transcriptional regulator
MTINVSKDVEISINAAVQSGRFPSVDDAVTAAWLAFNQQPSPRQGQPAKATALDELHRQMLADGVISQLPDTANDFDDEDDEPVTIEGEPLSETIIRERR